MNARILKLRYKSRSITTQLMRTKRRRGGVCAPYRCCWPRLLCLSYVSAGSGRPGRISHLNLRRYRGLLCASDCGYRPIAGKLSQRTAQVTTRAESRSRKQQQRDQSGHNTLQKHPRSIHQNVSDGLGAFSSLPHAGQTRESHPKSIVPPD